MHMLYWNLLMQHFPLLFRVCWRQMGWALCMLCGIVSDWWRTEERRISGKWAAKQSSCVWESAELRQSRVWTGQPTPSESSSVCEVWSVTVFSNSTVWLGKTQNAAYHWNLHRPSLKPQQKWFDQNIQQSTAMRIKSTFPKKEMICVSQSTIFK